MNHEQAQLLIRQQFVDGALDPVVNVRLRSHLRACAPCRMAYDRWAEAELSLGSGADVDAAERLWPTIEASIAAPPRSWQKWGAAVTALAAAVAGIALWPQTSPESIAPYSVEITPLQKSVRAPSPEPIPVIARHGELDVVLRPARVTDQHLEVAAYWVAGDRVVAMKHAAMRSPLGAIRIVGPARELTPEPGEWTLVIALSRAEGSLSRERLVALGAAAIPTAQASSFAPTVTGEDEAIFVIPARVVDERIE